MIPAGDLTRRRVAVAVRRAVDGSARAVVTTGTVIAAMVLLRDSGAGTMLAWLVALTASSYVLVAVWLMISKPVRPPDVVRAGARVSAFAVLTTLVGTSSQLFFQLLAVLAALFLISLRRREATAREDR